MKKTMVLGAVILLCLTQNAWAMRTTVHDAAESPEYGRKFGGMIGRGVINVTTSFVDLLVNIVNETKSGPAVVGTLVGIGKGAGCTTLRALSGATDLATFWVPGFNGFPVSDSYDNCLSGMSTSAQAPAAHAAVETFGEPDIAPVGSAPSQPSSAVMPSSASVPSRTEKPRYTK